MIIALAVFVFLTASLWGSYIGASINRKDARPRIPLPRKSTLIMNWLFTFIAISISFTTPASELAGIIWIACFFIGVILGFCIGRSTYVITKY